MTLVDYVCAHRTAMHVIEEDSERKNKKQEQILSDNEKPRFLWGESHSRAMRLARRGSEKNKKNELLEVKDDERPRILWDDSLPRKALAKMKKQERRVYQSEREGPQFHWGDCHPQKVLSRSKKQGQNHNHDDEKIRFHWGESHPRQYLKWKANNARTNISNEDKILETDTDHKHKTLEVDSDHTNTTATWNDSSWNDSGFSFCIGEEDYLEAEAEASSVANNEDSNDAMMREPQKRQVGAIWVWSSGRVHNDASTNHDDDEEMDEVDMWEKRKVSISKSRSDDRVKRVKLVARGYNKKQASYLEARHSPMQSRRKHINRPSQILQIVDNAIDTDRNHISKASTSETYSDCTMEALSREYNTKMSLGKR